MITKNICREFQKIKGRTIVGLTGTIASGKSAVLDRLRKLGTFCISTDALAKEVLTSRACYNRISVSFSPGVFLKDGSINRKKLAEEVFSDKSKRKLLESILHPLILDRALVLIKRSHAKLIVVEVPLLFEAGLEKCFALTVCVDAPYGLRLRHAADRGWSAGEFRCRSAAQLSAREKSSRADMRISNDGSLKDLGTRVDRFYKFLKNKQEKK